MTGGHLGAASVSSNSRLRFTGCSTRPRIACWDGWPPVLPSQDPHRPPRPQSARSARAAASRASRSAPKASTIPSARLTPRPRSLRPRHGRRPRSRRPCQQRRGRDRRRRHECRMAYEAINNAGARDERLIVILKRQRYVDCAADRRVLVLPRTRDLERHVSSPPRLRKTARQAPAQELGAPRRPAWKNTPATFGRAACGSRSSASTT